MILILIFMEVLKVILYMILVKNKVIKMNYFIYNNKILLKTTIMNNNNRFKINNFKNN
jgi:hypothetical protein